MPLTLTCGDSSGIGGFVLMISMKRFSRVLRKIMETPWMRIWGAMPCKKGEGGRMKDESDR
jgi:hypothetical protein